MHYASSSRVCNPASHPQKLYLLSLLAIAALAVITLPACGSRPAYEPASKAAPTFAAQSAATSLPPTATVRPRVTLPEPTPSPTASPPPPQPTATPEPESAAQPPEVSFSSPAVDGPWLVFATSEGLWAVNADGSGLRQLTRRPVVGPDDLHLAVSPRGEHLAFITAAHPVQWRGLTLNLLTLPGGEVKRITPLTSAAVESGLEAGPGAPAFEAVRAVVELTSLAWSPNGQQLAFMSVHEGPSSDLYVYSLAEDRITRLTDGPSQGYRPSWSPDGKYIVHVGATTFGTGAGYGLAGVWAARADDSGVKSLYTPRSGDEVVVGWVAPDTFVVHSWSTDCGTRALRTVNIETGAVDSLWEDYFNSVALDPGSGRLLLSVDRWVASCNPDGRFGLFLLSAAPGVAGRQPAVKLEVETGIENAQLAWSAEASLFLVQTQAGTLMVGPDGEVIQAVRGLVSTLLAAPTGQKWAWSSTEFEGQPGVWVGAIDQEPVQVSTASAAGLVWGPDSQSLFFFGQDEDGGGLYLARSPDFKPVLVAEDVQVSNQGMVWVWP